MYYIYTHNEEGFDYKTLTIEETEALKEVQKRHKTINNDDILIAELLKLKTKEIVISSC